MREYEDFKTAESRAWLEYVGGIKNRIKQADDTLDVIRKLAEPRGIDYTKPIVTGSKNVDVMAEMVAAMDELKQKWLDDRKHQMAELADALEVIDSLTDFTSCKLIKLRYIEGLKWEQVGKAMGYDANYANGYLDRKAMLALHEVLPHEWKTSIPQSYK